MAMHFDITDFRLFINIAETSSLTRGAERSFLSVPATSNRIKNLEDNLGMRLLERSPQGVTLTNAGKTYLQHARVILSQLELLTGDLQQFTEGLKGQLRLLANTTAITEYLPPVVGEYLRSHPDVHIDMRERLSDDIVRAIREGSADLGIVSGSVVTDGLQSVPFVYSRLMIIAPQDHPILRQEEVYFKDALAYEFVSLLEGSALHVFLNRAASALHIPWNIRVQVASSDAIFRMVEAGAGIAIVPQAGYERLKGRQNLGSCKLLDPWAVRTFQLCAQDFDGLSTFARDFADSLIDWYRTPDTPALQA
ncbi:MULTISPECIES: LysR substrate-binding domain-containing protein [Pseudomonas]|jgi:DNA-binding transcriptional LysR family regulator|uniref:LysR substrate-binding domain-containing protein n=1 Tax=Pseudomonas TaxID=286 RepID=UPI001C824C54|nr:MULTISPECIES: LysR substrate-binding domain-containing protein [Pseudomonas]MDG9930451.1 LysR substrate-binding domain-containing protein [Pseudomonas sp. GD04042]MDH0482999.1 LysR substrate-binding domain-containing protein [Pseudomonas sp. GD04015]MDH0605399.1 LysR substrate-binding domain-containing protein [Pseudomonas sp. GD03869]MDH0893423.1 LysR substrate-binding domain-containing protein [Pseudomonas sp. GD03875]MDH1066237.1 LysR substrate-binding domain-containing protein [Pseudomo